MRTILLNSVSYKTIGEVIQRRINPWKAQIRSTGSREYSDFSQAELEEYHDFRNGIGRKRGVGSDARLSWSEGIDFTIDGQAVLGSLVTTAGSFGVAPVKIIDFLGKTYAIGNSAISEWQAAGTQWISRDNSLSSPLDAIVVTDATDDYLVVSSATKAIYSVDGTNWNDLESWKSPDGFTDSDGAWATEANAYDDDVATDATTTTEDSYLELTLTKPVLTDRCRIYADQSGGSLNMDIDFYYEGAWTNIYSGALSGSTWTTKTNGAGVKRVEKARVRFTSVAGYTGRLGEFDFKSMMLGYMTEYANRLYGITSDGRSVTYSTTEDIDEIAGAFGLTSDFGVVYGMFTGKLLADDTPVPYMHTNKGLWSIDVTNEKAYRQEVNYAPLTNAGRAGMYANANLWITTGAGITKIAPSMAVPVGTDIDDGLPNGYQGDVYDMTFISNWLIFCVNGGSSNKSSIFKRNTNMGGNLQLYTTSATNKAIACLHHSPSSLYTNGRLWFGEGTDVKYMMLPDITSNVKQVSSFDYVNDSGDAELPIFRMLAAIPKTALGVAAITKSCDANDYIQVKYGLNGAAPVTSLGTFQSSPNPTALTFNSGLGTAFYTIQFAIKLYRGNTTTNSPELESLLFYYYPTPSRISAFTLTIDTRGEETADTIFTDIESILDTDTLVAFYPSGDSNKTSYNVKLTQMPSRSWWEEQGGREGVFQIALEEVFNP